MASWRRVTGVVGLAAGALAAGAGVAIAAEKIAVGRIRLRPDPAAGEALGQLRGRSLTVLTADGVPLDAEICGPDDAPVTIIFCHGYALNQNCWHYQRAGLAAAGRLVFWDQRGHGRSGRSGSGHVTIDQLGADLHAVMMAAVPGDSPVVLVGHSMGGMTIMALADQHPELFGTKIIGVALISTSASAVDPSGWLPAPIRPIARHAVPAVLRGAQGKAAAVIERARNAAGDLAFLGTRFIAFGDPQVSPAVVDFLERIIRATPVEVVAEFYLALLGHDKRAALGVLGKVPVLVLVGDHDRLVPPQLSEELAAMIPGADLVRVAGAGHVLILEYPEVVNDSITSLLARAREGRRARGQSA
jgi:pimeloyl-ACP methyl ester carboxylesterase